MHESYGAVQTTPPVAEATVIATLPAVSSANAETVVDQGLVAADQGLATARQDLVAADQGLAAAGQDLVAADQGLEAAGQDVVAADQGLEAAGQDLVAADQAIQQEGVISLNNLIEQPRECNDSDPNQIDLASVTQPSGHSNSVLDGDTYQQTTCSKNSPGGTSGCGVSADVTAYAAVDTVTLSAEHTLA
jgi:hypothetical protein